MLSPNIYIGIDIQLQVFIFLVILILIIFYLFILLQQVCIQKGVILIILFSSNYYISILNGTYNPKENEFIRIIFLYKRTPLFNHTVAGLAYKPHVSS